MGAVVEIDALSVAGSLVFTPALKSVATMATAFPSEPALDFLQLFWALNHAVERTSSRMQRDLGVTAQQRLLLRCLGKYPAMTPTSLAAILHLDRATISVAIRRLSKRKLLVRRRDVLDARQVRLELTPRGRVLTRPTRGTVESAVDVALASASQTELMATALFLKRLTRALDSGLA